MTFNDYNKLYKDYKGVVCFFGEDDTIIYANKVLATLLGYEQKEIIGVDLIEMIHPDDRTEFSNKVYLDTHHRNMTIRLFHKFGSHVYISISVFHFDHDFLLIGTQMKRQYKGFNFDITKDDILSGDLAFETSIDDISEILEDNIDALKILLDSLPIDFWIKDSNSRYLFLNKAMLQRTKINPDTYFLKNDFELYDQDIANDFVTSDMEAIKNKKKTQYVFESKSDRFVKWTEVSKVPLYNQNGSYIGMIASAIDITQTQGVIDELQQENKALLSILGNMFDVVFAINSEGIITNTLGDDIHPYRGMNYQDVFVRQNQVLKMIEYGFNTIESEINARLNSIDYNVTIKPIQVDEQTQRIIVFGKKVGR